MLRSIWDSMPKEMIKVLAVLSLVASIGIAVIFYKPITVHSSRVSLLRDNELNDHQISALTELRISKANQLILEGGREAVEVTGINITGSPITFDTPFTMENVSLDELKIGVKNLTGKTITHIKFGLHIRNSALESSEDTSYLIEYGNDTGIPGTIASNKLHPTETATVSISKTQAQVLKQLVTEKAPESARSARIEISIDMVIFDDDAAWRHGLMAKRSKDNPLMWEYISGKYVKSRGGISSLKKGLNSAGRQMKGHYNFLPEPGPGNQLMRSVKAETNLIGLKGMPTAPGGQGICAYPATFYYFFCTDRCFRVLDIFDINFPLYRVDIRQFQCADSLGVLCGVSSGYFIVGGCS
jgi:hypothetical protein